MLNEVLDQRLDDLILAKSNRSSVTGVSVSKDIPLPSGHAQEDWTD